jgi:hypothetical protein
MRHPIHGRTNRKSQREAKGQMPKRRPQRDAHSSTNTNARV